VSIHRAANRGLPSSDQWRHTCLRCAARPRSRSLRSQHLVTYATRLKAERNVAARRRAIGIAGAAPGYGSTNARANDMPQVWRADGPGSASSEGNGPRLLLRRVLLAAPVVERPRRQPRKPAEGDRERRPAARGPLRYLRDDRLHDLTVDALRPPVRAAEVPMAQMSNAGYLRDPAIRDGRLPSN
jgi:hypothetical protein